VVLSNGLSNGVGCRMLASQRTPLAKIMKLTKRTEGSLRQKAMKLGINLGHRR
jgi:hypothetical protein